MTRMVNTVRRQSGARRLSVLSVAIGASLLYLLAGLVGTPPNAGAATTSCQSRCVILIEVNGLEPKDITKANTPFLWALAHSGDQNNDPQASNYPALTGRNGWAWQAARTVMSTGDGPATEALLTGDTAEQSADPADVFAIPNTGPNGQTTLNYYKTGGSSGIQDASCSAEAPCDPVSAGGSNSIASSTVLSQAQSNNKNVGIWLGDPALCTIANNGLQAGTGLDYDKAPGGTTGGGPLGNVVSGPNIACPDLWGPFNQSGVPQNYQGQSPYCPPQTQWPTVDGTAYYPAACQVSDGSVLTQAAQDMTQGTAGYPDLNFIYLADVGKAKQLAGDSDCFSDPGLAQTSLAQTTCGSSGSSTTAVAPPSVSQALQTTDSGLAAFASALFLAAQQNPAVNWQNTYLMVVGSHGYETTPAPLRIPDPTATSDPTTVSSACSGTQTGLADLSCFVANDAGSTNNQLNAVLVPQGTMGTIYYTGPNDPQAEKTTLNTLVNDLCLPQSGQATCTGGSTVNTACQTLLNSQPATTGVSAAPNCIEKMYYVDPSSVPASDPSGPKESQFLFGIPGDPGYPTASNPTYDANPHCQSSSSGSPFYDASGCDSNLLGFYQQQQASWHLNVLDSSKVATNPSNPQNTTTVFKPSGTGGQLVVVFGPGWAAGPLATVGASTNNTGGGAGGVLPTVLPGSASDPIDPYTGSSGGPRDRAIAAIVNGPASGGTVDPVVQYPDGALGSGSAGMAPVTGYDASKVSPSNSDPYVCSPSFLSGNAKYSDSATSASFAVDQANADPSNDGAALGSPVFNSQSDSYVPAGQECQAQIIDFAPTIEGLQSISASSSATEQADARFLDEAFAKCVGQNTSDTSGPACGNLQTLGQAVPPPPPPVVPIITPPQKIIIIPPKKPKPFNFDGLLRNVQAQVVDQSNHTVPFARPGGYLSSVRITADFGKTNSEVTITLYKLAHPAADHSAHASRVNLTAIVRFCPFTVQRDPNVQLRFEVPTAYQPDHVGVSVREVHMLPSATGPGCGKAAHNAFVAFGPEKGAIAPVLDARLLHKFKPCPVSLSFTVPHGPGVNVQSAEILKGNEVVRTISAGQLASGTLTLPASGLPGGFLKIRVQWVQSGQRKTASHTYLSGTWNCTVQQRRKLGTG